MSSFISFYSTSLYTFALFPLFISLPCFLIPPVNHVIFLPLPRFLSSLIFSFPPLSHFISSPFPPLFLSSVSSFSFHLLSFPLLPPSPPLPHQQWILPFSVVAKDNHLIHVAFGKMFVTLGCADGHSCDATMRPGPSETGWGARGGGVGSWQRVGEDEWVCEERCVSD